MPSPFDKAQAARAQPGGERLAITLVPGTWAYGIFVRRNMYAPATPPRWFEPGSAFRALLESELTRMGFDYTLDVHQWDGANSVRRRAAEADRLSATLTAQQQPGLRRIVIGHSHGGTVALRAASLTPSSNDDLSVITLSTPFLQVSARHEDSPRIIATTILIFPLMLAIVGFIAREGGTRLELLPRFLAVCLVLTGFFFYRLREEEDTLADLVNSRVTYGASLLVLRGFSDEAGNSLVLGSVGAGLMNGIFYAVAFPARWIVSGKPWRIICAIVLMYGSVFCLFRYGRPLFRLLHLWTLIAAWLSVGLIPLLIAGFFALLYGRELFFQALKLLFTVDSVPDTVGTADVVTLSQTRVSALGLRHGLYDHPGCARLIAYWLATGLTWHYANATPYSVEHTKTANSE